LRKRVEQVALVLPPRETGASAFRWLCSALRAAILDGRLRPGTRLPATRDLARQCRVSRGPALQGLDRHGVVLFAGSFSKVLYPSIRLGYLVVPKDLVDRVSALKSIANRFAPVLEQATLSDFITEGHFGRHVRRMREVYAERLGVLLESGRQTLAGLLDISDVEAGLQTVAWLERNIDGMSAAAMANERNVEVIPVSRYCREPIEREGLVLGFAAVDAREIKRGVRELAAALERCRRRR
jgi:GntR family transcriptional regulator/MocR family aminotransferase